MTACHTLAVSCHVLNYILEPVILQAQPSPTTGKFSFVPNGDSRSSTLISESPDRTRDNLYEGFVSAPFAFKPVAEPASSFSLGAAIRVIVLNKDVCYRIDPS